MLEKIIIDGWIENLHTSQEFRESFPNSRFASPMRQPAGLVNPLLDFTDDANVPITSSTVVGFDTIVPP